jgi:hypothetical protein
LLSESASGFRLFIKIEDIRAALFLSVGELEGIKEEA